MIPLHFNQAIASRNGLAGGVFQDRPETRITASAFLQIR
jgi:hypothetical protein